MDTREKLTKFHEDLQNITKFSNTLTDIFITEFEELIVNILIKNESEFMRAYSRRMNLILTDLYSNEALEFPELTNLMKKCEKDIYINFYKVHLSVLQTAVENDRVIHSQNEVEVDAKTDNEGKKSCDMSFRKHCRFQDSSPRHLCNAKQISSSFIPAYGDCSKKISHVICRNCMSVYLASSMKLFCSFCSISYYSAIENEDDSQPNSDIQPATWERYHCSAVINDQIKCLQCAQPIFIDLKQNLLICKNTKCGFTADPYSISWQCLLCNQLFKTNVKIYNPLDFKVMKYAIREALLNKIPARPTSLPCCKRVEELSKINLKHKIDCDGIIYLGEMEQKKIIVCIKCKALINYHKFIWTCPFCEKRVKSKESSDSFTPEKPKQSPSFKISSQNLTKGSNTVKLSVEHNGAPVRQMSIPTKNIDSKPYESVGPSAVTILDDSGINNSKVNGKKRNESSNYKELDHERESLITPVISLSSSKCNQKRIFTVRNPSKSLSTSAISKETIFEISPCKNQSIPTKIANSIFFSSLGDNPWDREECKKSEEKVCNEKKEVESREISPVQVMDNLMQTPEIENRKTKTRFDPTAEVNYTPNKLKIIPIDETPVESYVIISQIGKGSFGKIYAVTNNDKENFAMKKEILSNVREVDACVKQYTILHSLEHDNLIKIKGIWKKQLDPTTYGLYIFQELGLSDWDKEIQSRQKTRSFYNEKELINILKQLTSASAYLQSYNISHRDIKPQNIIVFNDFVYKIGDFGEVKDHQEIEFDDNMKGTELFMSPLLYYSLKTGDMQQWNNFKSDCFSLGMCLLYAATLSYNPLYEIRQIDMKSTTDYSFQNIILAKILNSYLKLKFSKYFVNVMSRMLNFNEKERFDFVDLNELLEEY